MRHPGTTPPFRGPRNAPVPGSIAEVRYLRIGGIDQWALIRGECATNPPLVLLHGGPGMSETPFVDEPAKFNAAMVQMVRPVAEIPR